MKKDLQPLYCKYTLTGEEVAKIGLSNLAFIGRNVSKENGGEVVYGRDWLSQVLAEGFEKKAREVGVTIEE